MNIILKGNIIYSKSPTELSITECGYLICQDNIVRGVYTEIPAQFSDFPVKDYGDYIIIPGLCDLHTHAPQYAYRGLGFDLELLEWLNTYTYPEEDKYSDIEYAGNAYKQFTAALTCSATTRACIFATNHLPATVLLMDMLENSGIVSFVGLVNMDRNCSETLKSENAKQAYEMTEKWIAGTINKYQNTKPIITPRFIPSCSDELMTGLGDLQKKYKMPVQSHMSENLSEIEWVKELVPCSKSYADAYNKFGLLGSHNAPAIMAHCVWCSDDEKELIRNNGVYIAHCPQSNINIASGIAPIRDYLSRNIHVGLGTDVAGGVHLSVFRAISDAITSSKMYWRLIDDSCKPLSFSEAFYLATAGGGEFFGKVGMFADGYEFDAVVLDDTVPATVYPLTLLQRLERITYLGAENIIADKYVRGEQICMK